MCEKYEALLHRIYLCRKKQSQQLHTHCFLEFNSLVDVTGIAVNQKSFAVRILGYVVFDQTKHSALKGNEKLRLREASSLARNIKRIDFGYFKQANSSKKVNFRCMGCL